MRSTLLFALSIILLIGCSQQNSMDAKIKSLIIKHRGTPASQQEVEEVRYIWQKSQKIWNQYPGRIERFFEWNFHESRVEKKYIGKSIEEARKGLTGNPDFPYEETGKPEKFKDLTIYHFECNLVAMDVMVKDGIVVSMYFFDLG